MSRISARDPVIRRAAIQLIGNGKFDRLDLIVAQAEAGDALSPAREVLQVIGSRRLVELSCASDESVRKAAAAALCILFRLPGGDATRQKLTVSGTPEAKTVILNNLCRYWPQAVGVYVAIVNDQEVARAVLHRAGRPDLLPAHRKPGVQISARCRAAVRDSHRTLVRRHRPGGGRRESAPIDRRQGCAGLSQRRRLERHRPTHRQAEAHHGPSRLPALPAAGARRDYRSPRSPRATLQAGELRRRAADRAGAASAGNCFLEVWVSELAPVRERSLTAAQPGSAAGPASPARRYR